MPLKILQNIVKSTGQDLGIKICTAVLFYRYHPLQPNISKIPIIYENFFLITPNVLQTPQNHKFALAVQKLIYQNSPTFKYTKFQKLLY